MSEGKIKFFNQSKGYGFIKRAGESDVFFHISTWRGGGQPEENTAVRLDVALGRKGPQALNVYPMHEESVLEAAVEAVAEEETSPDEGYRFLNPYNFVRFLKEPHFSPDDPPEIQLIGRCPPPPHDRWVGVSGEIRCRVEAVTPLFVSDSEDVVVDDKGHRTYRFFNVNGEKMIPGSSLRGSVRSVFESITNSCFANFTDARLSYRLDARDARQLVPARIVKNENEENTSWILQLLPGTAELAINHNPKELYAAPLRQYRAFKSTGQHKKGNPPPPVDLDSLGSQKPTHGQECWAVLLKMKFPPSWRVIAVGPDRAAAEQKKAEMLRSDIFRSSLKIQKGWLCITNQNIDNKNSERFFFENDDTTADFPRHVTLLPDVVKKYEDLIQDYQDRHERDVQKRKKRKEKSDPARAYSQDDVAFSRFILDPSERTVKGGELVYAMVRGRGHQLQIEFIAPVSIPRVAYNFTIGAFLPEHVRKCSSLKALCPACRTFGWVKDKRDNEGAYAGRVRFSHAQLEVAKPAQPMKLAVLGSPKPTTARFYLVGSNGQPSRTPREQDEVGYNNKRNQLRGRKIYRHHQPEAGQLHLPPDKLSDQNRTILDPEDAGAVFSFTIAFENLAPMELGALLWALDLGGKGYHRIGYGKPLGLGSARITAETVRLRDIAARYRSLSEDGLCAPLTKDECRQHVATFQRAAAWPYSSAEVLEAAQKQGVDGWKIAFEDLPNIQDLLALIGTEDPGLPVHYPHPPKHLASKGQFEWFVGNSRAKGPKVELDLANQDQGLPLIDKYGEVY